ncbi:segregation and condensation protein A [Sorangium atrum]|uniref:Segregation and condensation protein A n=1 Tax=Sorangium atrum TaxID=2995308 RepID=A0ABT5CAV7_9BACT|nr:segregation/condensation protein A [Sorangium aterium]MDC0683574.1 segregation/condensation protein A [Sorangium aterium]
MSGSKASAARARNGRGRGNAGAAPAPAARQAAPSPAREVASPAREIASPAADAGPREGEYVVTLPTFEGPLDLLLHLIQQHELDILDIPVSFVTEKYLEYLKLMRSLSIDLASEYLVMAATLTHIKSKMLLPSVPAGQDDDGMPGEEEDPRAELVRRLLEYQKYKVAAADLAERGTLGRDVFTRGMSESEVPKGPAPFAQTAIFSLLDAFERVLKRTNVQIDHEVVFDRISITDRIVELTEKLSARRAMRFEDLLLDSVSKGGVIPRFEVVITFLAVLEMCKLRLIRVHQTDPLAPIHIQLAVADGAPVVFDGSEDGVPMAFDGSEDGAPTAERIETAGSEEAGAPPAAAEGEKAEAVEVGRSEPAGPELVEPVEPTSGAPSGAEPAGASSVAPESLEPVEPVEQVEDVSAEAEEPEPAEAAEESSSEPAWPEPAEPVELVEPLEDVSAEAEEPEPAEAAEESSSEPSWSELAEPVEPLEDVSAEAAGLEPAEAAEESSSEPSWSELAEPVEERNVEAGDAELAEAVEPTSGEPAWSELAEPAEELAEPAEELAEPAEESSGEASATDLPGAAEETSRADDAAAGEPAMEAVEGDADPAPGEAERDAVVDPNAHSAAEDFAAPPAEVDEVDAGSGRDGG